MLKLKDGDNVKREEKELPIAGIGKVGSERYKKGKRVLIKQTRQSYMKLFKDILKKMNEGKVPTKAELEFVLKFWSTLAILETFAKSV